jgi:hypothetical protein
VGARRYSRPFFYTKIQRKGVKRIKTLPSDKKIIENIMKYVSENKDSLPILKECCLENDWSYKELCQRAAASPKVFRAVEILKDQREVNLEKKSVLGAFNKPMSIFLLERIYGVPDEVFDMHELDSLLDADISEAISLQSEGE